MCTLHRGLYACQLLPCPRNLIMECCMELLRMLSDEANMLCTTEKKQTIGPDHIIKARAHSRTDQPDERARHE